MEWVMQVWLAAEVQLLSVSGFPSDIPIAANPLHRIGIEATTGSRPKHLPAANPSPIHAPYGSDSAISTGKAVGNPVDGCRGFLAIEALAG